MVDPTKHRSFLSQNLNKVASEIGYIQFSFLQGGPNISSLPRTKSNPEMGVRFLTMFLVISSIEEHQDLIQQFHLCSYTMAISNVVV